MSRIRIAVRPKSKKHGLMRRFEKTYEVKTSAKDFFEALTNETIVGQWSGTQAIVSDEEGGKFSLWGGSIVGVNKEVSDSRLVQLWKEKNWPEHSQVVFHWKKKSEKLIVNLIHDHIPDHSYENIKRGWDEYYMNPLITWLESNNL